MRERKLAWDLCMPMGAVFPRMSGRQLCGSVRGAEQGDPNAQFDLGLMYQNGRGVTVKIFASSKLVP